MIIYRLRNGLDVRLTDDEATELFHVIAKHFNMPEAPDTRAPLPEVVAQNVSELPPTGRGRVRPATVHTRGGDLNPIRTWAAGGAETVNQYNPPPDDDPPEDDDPIYIDANFAEDFAANQARQAEGVTTTGTASRMIVADENSYASTTTTATVAASVPSFDYVEGRGWVAAVGTGGRGSDEEPLHAIGQVRPPVWSASNTNYERDAFPNQDDANGA